MRGIVLVVDDHKRPRRALTTELEDAGHAVNLDQPDLFNEAVLNYLASLDIR